jgi:hypothetical protein
MVIKVSISATLFISASLDNDVALAHGFDGKSFAQVGAV